MVKLQETESFIYGVGERLVIESTVELSFERFWSVLIFIFSILSFILIRTLRQGIHDLRVWPGKEANGDSNTLGKPDPESSDEMSKLAKVFIWLFNIFLCS